MESNAYYKRKKELRVFVGKIYPDLVQLKKEDNRAAFNSLVLEIIPSIRSYINRRLSAAIQKGHFSKGKYKADDFIDQLFIEIYDHIEEVEHEKDFYKWLFKKTNDLLDDTIVEEEFDDFFFKNIDDYTKPEWDEMQENFSTDGDGDLMMIEELDDRSYNHNDYILNHVFVEDKEKELLKKIDQHLSTEEIQEHVSLILHNLPAAMRNVFELNVNEHLDLEEIAQIRNESLKHVEQLLKDAKEAIQLSFLNRYSIH
jgi:RNA polymerase sigma factor (sigma-70 family)